MNGYLIDAAHERVDRLREDMHVAQRMFGLLDGLWHIMETCEEMDNSKLVSQVAASLKEQATQAGDEVGRLNDLLADAIDHMQAVDMMKHDEDERERAALEREFNLDRYASVRGV